MAKSKTNSESGSGARLLPLGRVLFGVGIGLIAVRGMEVFTQMPGLPSYWYANQPLWVALGFGLTALGWQVLWGRRAFETPSWRPNAPGRRFHTATIYVSDGCHLCDDAILMLASYQRWIPSVETIPIQSDQELVERFGTCVPVVVFDGKIRFRGRIDETLLRRLIEGTPPISSAIA